MKSKLMFSVIIFILLSQSIFSIERKRITPPETKIDNIYDTLHNTVIIDPYRWLEDGSSEEVVRWTEEQNEYFRKYVESYEGYNLLASIMEKLLTVGSVSPPEVYGHLYFYEKREGNWNHSILYRREEIEGEDEILIDPNTFSEDGTVAMDWHYFSNDAAIVAYGVSSSGSEKSTMYLKNTADKTMLSDSIPFTRAVSMAWLPDNSGFYYSRFPAPGTVPEEEEDYHRNIYFHVIGQNWEKDELIYADEDITAWTNVSLSPDGSKLFISVFIGWSDTKYFYRDLNNLEGNFQFISDNHKANLSIIPLNDRFIIRSNYNAPQYKLLTGSYEKPEAENWVVIIPEGKSLLESYMVVNNQLVIKRLTNACSALELYSLYGKYNGIIELPDMGTVYNMNGEYDGKEMFFSYSSYNRPTTIYHYLFNEKKLSQFDQVEAGVDFSNLVVKQVWYHSKDSTPVSMFILHHKDMKLNGENPVYLYGYGGFNVSEKPFFSRSLAFWVNQGGIFALPNLRGGGEYGEEWHEAGKLDKKQNTFDDFIAAAEYLFSNGYTSSDHLCISGGSNGGLLIGAILVQRPDLCKTAVCSVPLLDMVRYHLFGIARIWIPEYGSSDDPGQFKFIYDYSPYHHVEKGVNYPTVLFEAGASDGRVDALHARKMTALMQASTASANPIFLRVETKAGHGQGKPISKVIQQQTEQWSFIFKSLGLDVKKTE